jgi:hypothetical protein
MGTTFASATSTLKCMVNFGLTQWILGASSAVFPGALPTIDAQKAAITAWLQNARQSFWTRTALSTLGKLNPDLNALLNGNNPDFSGAYQKLGSQGLLTANVFRFSMNSNGDVQSMELCGQWKTSRRVLLTRRSDLAIG